MDNDVLAMNVPELQKEIMKLREGIRKHRDQKGDENCWLDDKFYLYGLLPEKVDVDPELPEKPLMMTNCSRYYDCRKEGKEYVPLTKLQPLMTFSTYVKILSDDELWLLTCGIEELHDSMRHNREEYIGNIVAKAADMREILEDESNARKLDHTRWER